MQQAAGKVRPLQPDATQHDVISMQVTHHFGLLLWVRSGLILCHTNTCKPPDSTAPASAGLLAPSHPAPTPFHQVASPPKRPHPVYSPPWQPVTPPNAMPSPCRPPHLAPPCTHLTPPCPLRLR